METIHQIAYNKMIDRVCLHSAHHLFVITSNIALIRLLLSFDKLMQH